MDSLPLRRRDLEFEIEPLLAFSDRLVAGAKFLPSLPDGGTDRVAEFLCVPRSYLAGGSPVMTMRGDVYGSASPPPST